MIEITPFNKNPSTMYLHFPTIYSFNASTYSYKPN